MYTRNIDYLRAPHVFFNSSLLLLLLLLLLFVVVAVVICRFSVLLLKFTNSYVALLLFFVVFALVCTPRHLNEISRVRLYKV